MARRLKLGQLLISKGLLTPEQLAAALAEQERWGSRLGMTLVRMGTIQEEMLVKILSRQLQLPVARISGKRVKSAILEKVPAELAEKYRCLPLFTREEGGREVLFVGMDDPSDLKAIDEISFRIEQEVKPVLVAPTELEAALHRNYHGPGRGRDAEAPPEPDTAPEAATMLATSLPPLKRVVADADTDQLDDTDPETDPQLPPIDATLSGLEDPPDFASLAPLGEDPVLGGGDLEDPAAMSFSAAGEAPVADLAQAPFGESDPEIGDFTGAPFGGSSAFGSIAGGDTGSRTPVDSAAASAALEAKVIMQALAQLLVEKGVIGRDEFAERIRKLAARNPKSS
ncbi:MAG: hypothetical protein ACR2P8_11665 [Myxococcota bacterium]